MNNDERIFNKGAFLNKYRWFGQSFNKFPRLLLFVVKLSLVIVILFIINKYFFDEKSVNHQLIIQYLSTLKWELLILTIFVLLKPKLPELIDRIRTLNKDGFTFDPKTQQENVDSTSLPSTANQTDSSKLDLETSEGRAKASEEVPIKYELEKVYRIIFGTQISAIFRLHNFPDGLTQNDLSDLYARHAEKTPHPFPDFYSWIQYLVGSSLINYDPSTAIYRATNVGLLFLEYLNAENLLFPVTKNF